MGALPWGDRQDTLNLYLDRIQKVSFGFHIAILRRNVRKQFGERPSRQAIRPLADQHGMQMRVVAEVYKFL